jgi:hypothetical protein
MRTCPYDQKLKLQQGSVIVPSRRVVSLLRSIMGRRLRIGGGRERMQWAARVHHRTGVARIAAILAGESSGNRGVQSVL